MEDCSTQWVSSNLTFNSHVSLVTVFNNLCYIVFLGPYAWSTNSLPIANGTISPYLLTLAYRYVSAIVPLTSLLVLHAYGPCASKQPVSPGLVVPTALARWRWHVSGVVRSPPEHITHHFCVLKDYRYPHDFSKILNFAEDFIVKMFPVKKTCMCSTSNCQVVFWSSLGYKIWNIKLNVPDEGTNYSFSSGHITSFLHSETRNV